MAKASTSQLPRAYLRMSPNLDMHPDPGGMVMLLCAANRQPIRGRFRDRQTLERILGRARFRKLIDRHDLIVLEDGRYYVEGWDEWQEGDLTVADRQRRIRDKRARGSQHGNGNVTPPALPDRDVDRNGPSRRKAIGDREIHSKGSQGRESEESRAAEATDDEGSFLPASGTRQ